MIGYAFCGSFCTHEASLAVLSKLLDKGYPITPIFSETAYQTDTKFGKAAEIIEKVETMCGRKITHTIPAAERFGPTTPLDTLIIAPCTGNTLAKLSHGITDTAVCMSAKAHLRQNRPLLIALASNDAMSANLENIARLLNRKNVYFVPMRQDDPNKKPHSLVADFDEVVSAYEAMLQGTQLRPLFL